LIVPVEPGEAEKLIGLVEMGAGDVEPFLRNVFPSRQSTSPPPDNPNHNQPNNVQQAKADLQVSNERRFSPTE